MISRVVLLVGLAVFSSFAQSPLGTVGGLALDPASQPVATAKITLSNTLTGVTQSSTSNNSGNYAFANVPPGRYKLSASATGFKNIETPEFPVDAYRTIREDLRFEIGPASSEVTVSENVSTVIQTDTPSISASLTSRQIIDLPTNLRSVYSNAGDSGLIFIMLPETIPGVVQVGSGAKWITPGGLAAGTKLKVDGIETDFGNFGAPDSVSQPSMETIQEFTANIMTNKAEFGGIGTITSTTKSGTNQYHGSLFEYARNSDFDARNTFLTTKPLTNLHNYGLSGGGPAIRNKTFFYGVFDGTRGVRGYGFTSSVPTTAQLGGDFSAFGTVRNPFANNAAFPNSQIPTSLLSPQALKAAAQFYPAPNFGPATSNSGNYRAAFNGPEVHHIFEIRLDHNFSDRHSAFVRYQNKKDDYEIPGARSLLPPSSVGTSTNIRRVNFWTVGDVFAPTPTISNEVRAGALVLVSASDDPVRGAPLLQQFGITGLTGREGVKGVPNISIAGLTTVTQSLLNPVNDGHWQLSDNLTWVHRRHTMKFGAEYVNWFVNRYLTTNGGLFGNFGFTTKFSGNAVADFLLGLPSTVARVDPFPTQYNRWHDLAFYAQDNYKVLPKLTLSLGLRYEFNQPVHANNDNIYSFDLASGSVVIPNDNARKSFSQFFPTTLQVVNASQLGLDRSLRNADKNNWAPRLGASYQIDGKTVFRAGAGMFYSHLSGNIAAVLGTGPYAVSTTVTNTVTNNVPLLTLAAPFSNPGSPGTLSLTAIAPRLLNSVIYQYSATLERQLTNDMGLRLSYIGSHGSQLLYERNVNQPIPSATAFSQSRRPYPLYSNIVYGDNGANSSYNALQMQFQKRMSRGLLLSSAYTWAKELSEIDDNNDFELNTLIENAYDRRRDRANVYAVPRHQWENQVVYDLPFKGLLAGGWEVTALLNLSSGNWLNPQFTGSDPSNTNTTGGRPDLIAPVKYPGTANLWFDPASFAVPAGPGQFGNSARNAIEGPGFILFNMGASKSIKTERFGALQFGASFQNLLNHVNLGEPSLTINNNTNAAKITSTHIFPPAGSPRNGQIFARWNF